MTGTARWSASAAAIAQLAFLAQGGDGRQLAHSGLNEFDPRTLTACDLPAGLHGPFPPDRAGGTRAGALMTPRWSGPGAHTPSMKFGKKGKGATPPFGCAGGVTPGGSSPRAPV